MSAYNDTAEIVEFLERGEREPTAGKGGREKGRCEDEGGGRRDGKWEHFGKAVQGTEDGGGAGGSRGRGRECP